MDCDNPEHIILGMVYTPNYRNHQPTGVDGSHSVAPETQDTFGANLWGCRIKRSNDECDSPLCRYHNFLIEDWQEYPFISYEPQLFTHFSVMNPVSLKNDGIPLIKPFFTTIPLGRGTACPSMVVWCTLRPVPGQNGTISTGWGPQSITFSCLCKWLKMVDITIVNGGDHGL